MTTTTRRPAARRTARIAAVTAAVAVSAGTTMAMSAPAEAAPRKKPAKVSVTIEASQNGYLSGTVSSKNAKCKNDRSVWVYQQVGTRGGADDMYLSSDVTGLSGGVYRWDLGSYPAEGYVYAIVPGKKGCKTAQSPTIYASRTV